jgi:hypothetical protein
MPKLGEPLIYLLYVGHGFADGGLYGRLTAGHPVPAPNAWGAALPERSERS